MSEIVAHILLWENNTPLAGWLEPREINCVVWCTPLNLHKVLSKTSDHVMLDRFTGQYVFDRTM